MIDNDLIPLCTSEDRQIANTNMNMENVNDNACLECVHAHSVDVLSERSIQVLPELSTIEESRSRLLEVIPDHGMYIFEHFALALCWDLSVWNTFGSKVVGILPYFVFIMLTWTHDRIYRPGEVLPIKLRGCWEKFTLFRVPRGAILPHQSS